MQRRMNVQMCGKVYYWGTTGKEYVIIISTEGFCCCFISLKLFQNTKVFKSATLESLTDGIAGVMQTALGPEAMKEPREEIRNQIQNLSLDCLDSKLGPPPPEVSEPYSTHSSLTDRRVWRKGRDI